MFTQLARDIRLIEWKTPRRAAAQACRLLETLAQDRQGLRQAVADCRVSPRLWEMCEHYDILDKLVLYHDHETDARLRLHVFEGGAFDRPHNHRWSYAAYLLAGAYEHHLYTLHPAHPTHNERAHPQNLQLEFAEYRKQGSSYFLKENLYHAIGAEVGTATLIVRGPASRDRFTVMDRLQGSAWSQTAHALESAVERDKKRMTDTQYQHAVRRLEEMGVF